jgi:hypothetical protein
MTRAIPYYYILKTLPGSDAPARLRAPQNGIGPDRNGREQIPAIGWSGILFTAWNYPILIVGVGFEGSGIHPLPSRTATRGARPGT